MKAAIVITLLLLMSCTARMPLSPEPMEQAPPVELVEPPVQQPALEEPGFEGLGDIEQDLDFSELEELNQGLAELEI